MPATSAYRRHSEVDSNGKVRRRTSAEIRFWNKVDITGECWLWLAAKDPYGYGRFKDARPVGAHRWAYETYVGPITEETLDHLCRTRSCVRFDHLEPVSRRENVLRGVGRAAINARKTHCLRGHPLLGSNLYVELNGSRHCRMCHRLEERARRKARREMLRA